MSIYNAVCTREFQQADVTIKVGQTIEVTCIQPPIKKGYKIPYSPYTWRIKGIADEISSVDFSNHFKVPQTDKWCD
ncbi:MAG: hypothetical protein Q8P20_01875 [bacterium]|nr:hypothetical protein [bacterium]